MRHKNTSLVPVPLASGRVLAPGDTTRDDEVTDDDQAQIDAGRLTEVQASKPKPKAKPEAKPSDKESSD